MLIAGHDVVFVPHQLGHASPKITLDLYGHLFDRDYELRRGEEVVATGHFAIGRTLAPGEGVPFGAGMATVKEVRPSLGGVTRLVLELEPDL